MSVNPLFIGPCWGSDSSLIGTVNKMLVDDINHLARDTNTEIPMNCVLLKEESKITEEERREAKKYNVSTVFGARPPRGKAGQIGVDCLDINTASYYGHIKDPCQGITHIISHIPEFTYAAFNIKESILGRDMSHPSPRIVMVVHNLPNDSEEDRSIANQLRDASLILSLGMKMFHDVDSILTANEISSSKHVCYYPNPAIEFLTITRDMRTDDSARGPQNILLYAENLDAADFNLAVASVTMASDKMLEMATEKDYLKMTFCAMHNNVDGKESNKNRFEDIKKSVKVPRKKINFLQETPPTKDNVMKRLKMSKLCIFPTPCDSPLLGTEALMAAYSGCPVLVSDHTGAAGLFKSLFLDSSIVKTTGDFEEDIKSWSTDMVKKLSNPKATSEEAKRVRQELLLDSSILDSHLKVIEELVGESSVDLLLDLEPVGGLLKERNIDNLQALGIPELEGIEDVHEYIYQFILYLLQQRSKIALSLLDSRFPVNLLSAWKVVLSVVEAQDRRMVGFHKGSLVLKVYCPTSSAKYDLLQEFKRSDAPIQKSMITLWKEILLCMEKRDYKAPWRLTEVNNDVKQIASIFVQGILSRKSGLIPGSSFELKTGKLTEIAQRLDIQYPVMLYLLLDAMMRCAGERILDGGGADYENQLMERVVKEACNLLLAKLKFDKSHFLCGATLSGHWSKMRLLGQSALEQVLRQLWPDNIEGDTLAKMIDICVDDTNFDTALPADPYTAMLLSTVGREKSAFELAEIIAPIDSDVIRCALKEAILAQDETDHRWSRLSEAGIYNLCREIRFYLGRNLLRFLCDNHDAEIGKKRREISPKQRFALVTQGFLADITCDIFVKTSSIDKLQEVLANITHMQIEEAAAVNLDPEKQAEIEKALTTALLRRLTLFAISNYGAFIHPELDLDNINIDEFIRKDRLIEDIKTRIEKEITDRLGDGTQRNPPVQSTTAQSRDNNIMSLEALLSTITVLLKVGVMGNMLRFFAAGGVAVSA